MLGSLLSKRVMVFYTWDYLQDIPSRFPHKIDIWHSDIVDLNTLICVGPSGTIPATGIKSELVDHDVGTYDNIYGVYMESCAAPFIHNIVKVRNDRNFALLNSRGDSRGGVVLPAYARWILKNKKQEWL
jgi:hypothetical protein